MSSDLEKALEPLVERVVRRLLGERRTDEYSKGNLPHGRRGPMVYKSFAAVVRTLPGATQDGPGGTWRISRADWHRARNKSVPLLSVVKSEPTVAELAKRSLEVAGRRGVR